MLAARHRLPLVDLDAQRRRRGRRARRSAARARARRRDPVRVDGDGACASPSPTPANLHGIDELRLATRYPLELGVASREDILAEIRKLVRASEAFGARAAVDEAGGIARSSEEEDVTDLEADDGVSDVPLVRLVNSILFQAAEDGASDIHFEPQEDALVVRFRIDGVLQEMQRIPKRMMPGVTTRLKVLAKLDIAERRKPQDGRISVNAAAAGRMLDVRVATLPTVEGESRRHASARQVEAGRRRWRSSASRTRCRRQLSEIVERPTGALLVTGPTGSGKSTTLFAALDAAQPARDQHHHRRGPGRVPARRASTRCRSTRAAA